MKGTFVTRSSLLVRICVAIVTIILLLPMHTFVFAQSTGTIFGTVFDASTAQPIQDNATDATEVWINVWTTEGQIVDGTGNDSSGNYNIALPPGTYRISAAGPYYVRNFYNGTGWNPDDATPLTVNAGDNVNIDFSLNPGGRIHGVVKNQSDELLGDMSVGLANLPFGDCTDNTDGSYVINGIPLEMDVKVTVWDNTCNGTYSDYAMQFWNNKDSENTADTIRLTSTTRDVYNVDFVLEPFTGFTGTIYDSSTGQPIPNDGTEASWAWVSLFDSTTKDHIRGTGNDENGNYRLYAAPGTYYIQGGGTYYVDYMYDTGDWENPTPVNVTAGQATTIDFYLDPAGRITGVVKNQSDEPLGNMGIGVANMPIGNCTQQDGSYDLRVPLDTPVKIAVWGDDCSGQPTSYARKWWDDKRTQATADEITLTMANRDRPNTDFTLEIAGVIEGVVYESNGSTPLSAEAFVAAFDQTLDEYIDGTPTNTSNGSYTLPLPPGTYLIATYADGYVFEYYDNAGPAPDTATAVTVTSGATTSGIDFSMDVGGAITGRVEDTQGNPIENVMVAVEDMRIADCTNENGDYFLNSYDSVPLNTPLKIWAGGDFTICQDGRTDYAQEFWQEAETSDSATTVTVTNAGTPVTGIDFTLRYWLDMDENAFITPSDAVYVQNRIGQLPANIRADVNNDGLIGVDDFNAVMDALGQTITP